jgi:hypothetical protein
MNNEIANKLLADMVVILGTVCMCRPCKPLRNLLWLSRGRYEQGCSWQDEMKSGGSAMKSLFETVVVAAALATPVMSFAQQSNAPVTRAQVRADLVSLEKLGYHAWDFSDTTYPEAIQEAEAKLVTQTAQRGVADSAAGAAQ